MTERFPFESKWGKGTLVEEASGIPPALPVDRAALSARANLRRLEPEHD